MSSPVSRQLFVLGLLLLPLLAVSQPLPGIDLAPGLTDALVGTLQSKGEGYRPRTEHLNPDGSPHFTNRLIREESPYLLQHAHNPVNWYGWGEEAFDVARREGKPVFLSIGYSTCHWCHVMERESFEDIEVARYLNQHFIAIKVDREQRPDLDARYMDAVVLMTGSGGWPMSSFLTPDGRPFFGGTYYPRDTFLRLLQRIDGLWKSRADELVVQAGRVMAAVEQGNRIRGEAARVDQAFIAATVEQLLGRYDELEGGFGEAPKFPNETRLLLLLQQYERRPEKRLGEALWHTLDAMAAGGIHDQVGGGFHRYAIDNSWLVPHFEKMLYTQALMARVYLHGWRLSGRSDYRRVAVQTLDYLLRDMRSADATFFSATDADSDGEEGRFFTWDIDELTPLLTTDQLKRMTTLFGMSRQGNFEGRNILYLPRSFADYAVAEGITEAQLQQELGGLRERLYLLRQQRPRPLRDEKVISGWNGLVITALAEAATLLGEERYRKAAEAAAETLWRSHRRESGGLWRITLNGKPSIAAPLEDYVYVAEGFLALYDSTGDTVWLERSRQLADILIDRFWDNDGGGLFIAEPSPLTEAIGRGKPADDSPLPGPNSSALSLLNRLYRRSGEERYQRLANRIVGHFSPQLRALPGSHSTLLFAIDESQRGEWSRHRYLARGNLRVTLSQGRLQGGRLPWRLDLAMKPGWHINSRQPLQRELIPTRVEVVGERATLAAIDYPKAVTRRVGFISEPLSLYEGESAITGTATVEGEGTVRLHLNLQACSDKLCLAPESVELFLNGPDFR